MSGLFTILVIVFGVVFVCWFVAMLGEADAKRTKVTKERDEARRLFIKNLSDFTPNIFSDAGIGLDVDRHKIVIAPLGEDFKVLNFADILNVEVLKDGNTIGNHTGNLIGGAAVGALLLGPIGALLGTASIGNNRQQEFRKLSIKIHLKDLVTPIREVVFFESTIAKSATNPKVVAAIKEIDEWYGRLRAITHSNSPHRD